MPTPAHKRFTFKYIDHRFLFAVVVNASLHSRLHKESSSPKAGPRVEPARDGRLAQRTWRLGSFLAEFARAYDSDGGWITRNRRRWL
jgi:hypothetical protein